MIKLISVLHTLKPPLPAKITATSIVFGFLLLSGIATIGSTWLINQTTLDNRSSAYDFGEDDPCNSVISNCDSYEYQPTCQDSFVLLTCEPAPRCPSKHIVTRTTCSGNCITGGGLDGTSYCSSCPLNDECQEGSKLCHQNQRQICRLRTDPQHPECSRRTWVTEENCPPGTRCVENTANQTSCNNICPQTECNPEEKLLRCLYNPGFPDQIQQCTLFQGFKPQFGGSNKCPDYYKWTTKETCSRNEYCEEQKTNTVHCFPVSHR